MLAPEAGELSIYLKGDLAGILTLAENKAKPCLSESHPPHWNLAAYRQSWPWRFEPTEVVIPLSDFARWGEGYLQLLKWDLALVTGAWHAVPSI